LLGVNHQAEQIAVGVAAIGLDVGQKNRRAVLKENVTS